MNFKYQRNVTADSRVLWVALTDPESINRHLPKDAKVKSIDETEYELSLKVKAGFIRPTVKAKSTLHDVRMNESFEFNLAGKALGNSVRASARVVIEETESGSIVRLSGDVDTKGALNRVSDERKQQSITRFLDDYFQSVENS
ncbi:MAG: SRPBCC domain-containing protein [Dehalococcoidia bacterium]